MKFSCAFLTALLASASVVSALPMVNVVVMDVSQEALLEVLDAATKASSGPSLYPGHAVLPRVLQRRQLIEPDSGSIEVNLNSGQKPNKFEHPGVPDTHGSFNPASTPTPTGPPTFPGDPNPPPPQPKVTAAIESNVGTNAAGDEYATFSPE